jgi:hypothetical protein
VCAPHEAVGSDYPDYPLLCSWRVDVVLSSSSVSKVLRPSVLLRAVLSDGTVHTTELSVVRFHELRRAVAEAQHCVDSTAAKLLAAAR